jgi:hypothetical protein
MNKILITYFRKCGFIKPYERLMELLSDSMNYNFKKYQLLKIFYLESKYYFDNIQSEKSHVLTWKYFINLFRYLQAHDSFEDITQKQSYILMALALRIIIEYPIIGNIFKENKFMNKKKKQPNEIEDDFNNYIGSNQIYKLSETNSEKKIKHLNSICAKNSKLKIKRSSSFSKSSTMKIKNRKYFIDEEESKDKNNNKKGKRKTSLDLIRREENRVSSNFLEYASF